MDENNISNNSYESDTSSEYLYKNEKGWGSDWEDNNELDEEAETKVNLYFSEMKISYEDQVKEDYRNQLSLEEYLKIRNRICGKYAKEYDTFVLNAAKKRDEERAKIQTEEEYAKKLKEEIESDMPYQKFIKEKEKLEKKKKEITEENAKVQADIMLKAIEDNIAKRVKEITEIYNSNKTEQLKAPIERLDNEYTKTVKDKLKEYEAKINDDLTEAVGSAINQKFMSIPNMAQAKKIGKIVEHEENLPEQIKKDIAAKTKDANLPENDRFMDEININDGVYDIKNHATAYAIEISAVKGTFAADRANFRVAQGDHFDRINAIHKILKNNKKTGFTKNTKEYKAVLTELDKYEQGLITKGWYDVVQAEKQGAKLTPEQEKAKEDMLKQLNNVFDKATDYMVKKGPQKKSWGHGQARYDLMYLLCGDIYTCGGHAAEATSCAAKLQKDIAAGKTSPSAYLHQIPNASSGYEQINDRYEEKINAAMDGTYRVPGTKKEIENKRQEYLNKNNNDNSIINPENNNIIIQ